MERHARDFDTLEASLAERRSLVDAAIASLGLRRRAPLVEAALLDSLEAPGKRLRPVLAILVTEVFGAAVQEALPAAAAVELVHTASLILDDLPCMDDASRRRGRPACHVVHGEASAILAAFGLLNCAFDVLATGWPGAPDPASRLAIAGDLAAAIGLDGMIAGQSLDLAMTDRPVDFETLEFIHSRKTGALFMASAQVGARVAGADPAARAAVGAYAKNLGLAFQIVDDLIDVTGATGEAGKDVGKDVKKTTFVSFSGTDGAREVANDLVETSIACLAPFGAAADELRELARYVVARRR